MQRHILVSWSHIDKAITQLVNENLGKSTFWSHAPFVLCPSSVSTPIAEAMEARWIQATCAKC